MGSKMCNYIHLCIIRLLPNVSSETEIYRNDSQVLSTISVCCLQKTCGNGVIIKEAFYTFLPTNMMKDNAANDLRISHFAFHSPSLCWLSLNLFCIRNSFTMQMLFLLLGKPPYTHYNKIF